MNIPFPGLATAVIGMITAALNIQGAEEKPAAAAAEDSSSEKKESDYRNWFDVSAQGVWADGDKAQFMRQRQTRTGGSGGIESFHYEQDLPKKGLLQLDGRGIFDNHDYRLKVDADFPEIGFLRAGYSEFRTWYDGNGGFIPSAAGKNWFPLDNNELALDRSETWVEAGLRLPNIPAVTFRYSHQTRQGQKDSTSWAEATVPGLGLRGIVPTFYNINENRDIFQLDVDHHIGNTEFGVGVRYELTDDTDSREIHRRPGEPALDRYVTQRNVDKSDIFTAHAFTETRFTDKILLTTGYSYTTLDSDISGTRIYGPGYDPIYDPAFAKRGLNDHGFIGIYGDGISGGSELREYVMNLSLMYMPFDNFTIVPALRAEKETIDGESEYLDTHGPAAAPAAIPFFDLSNQSFTDVTESMEARYTGVTNWVFYARGEWTEGDGNLLQRQTALATGAVDTLQNKDDTRFTQKYTVGANWYPIGKLNLGAQYYRKMRRNNYDLQPDSTPADYPGFINDQDFDTDDMNARVTWRPLSYLSFVSRYDFQLSTLRMRMGGLEEVESADITTHIFSESVTWNPLPRWYLQASANYVLDRTENSVEAATSGIVLNPRNDYWTGTFTTGYALTEKTDLTGQYMYYRADDYADNSAVGMPYGAGAEEHGVTAGFLHRFSNRLSWSMKYSYFKYRDQTSGFNNNYEAHLVYSSVRCYF